MVILRKIIITVAQISVIEENKVTKTITNTKY